MSAIKVPDILIPKCDLTKWATVACDQFNADPEYWKTLEKFVGDSPSTLKLVCPEIYINDGCGDRTASAARYMDEYLRSGIFESFHGFVLTVRTLGSKTRVGLVAAIDLEKYDWKPVRSEIRATEETIEERLPVRVAIRKRAKLELPHVLTLLDDPETHVIEPLYARRGEFEKLYDFDLNMGGGHVSGYLIEKDDAEKILALLDGMLDKEVQTKKYGYDAGVLLAVGDGNHSLAAAKAFWESLKPELSEEERKNHPTRFALVEIVNLYGGVDFEPIHRLIFSKLRDEIVEKLKRTVAAEGACLQTVADGVVKIVGDFASSSLIKIAEDAAVALKKDGAEVEYIHGKEHLFSAVERTGGVGIVMPAFEKSELFGYMLKMGKLPKKAFSIGDAEFKRYYLESRLIKMED